MDCFCQEAYRLYPIMHWTDHVYDFLAICQVIQLSFWSVEGSQWPVRPVPVIRFCILWCFFLNLCYFKSSIKEDRWIAIFFVLSSSFNKNFRTNNAFAITFVGLFHKTDGHWSWKWRWQFVLQISYSLQGFVNPWFWSKLGMDYGHLTSSTLDCGFKMVIG